MAAHENVRFDDRVIIVTGAGRGMGRDHAMLLGARGAKVIVADNGTSLQGGGADESPANAVASEIRAEGGIASIYAADLTTENGAAGAVEAAIHEFGRIDAIVHNAGISVDPVAFELETSDRLNKVLAVNTLAGFSMIRAAWQRMKEQNFGRIILVSSPGIYGAPHFIPYSVAKASYIGMVKSLASEGASNNIGINQILPMARTRMVEGFPESEFRNWFFNTLRPEQISPLVAYLCSPDCQLSGEAFSVGGGRIARVDLIETVGDIGTNESIEEVRSRIEAVMSDTRQIKPLNTMHYNEQVAEILGFIPSSPVQLS